MQEECVTEWSQNPSSRGRTGRTQNSTTPSTLSSALRDKENTHNRRLPRTRQSFPSGLGLTEGIGQGLFFPELHQSHCRQACPKAQSSFLGRIQNRMVAQQGSSLPLKYGRKADTTGTRYPSFTIRPNENRQTETDGQDRDRKPLSLSSSSFFFFFLSFFLLSFLRFVGSSSFLLLQVCPSCFLCPFRRPPRAGAGRANAEGQSSVAGLLVCLFSR